ncbi:MAG: hypothetical protein M3007_05665, partial [Candidatus Eremiobacteraeota bacterium]|nr:hypothetical protein [Candidatus Eremiobacteraeota bacterium]
FARRPTIFVATAKSEDVAPHSRLERAIAKRAQVTFARDALTAAALARHGLNARWAGNVMMDGLQETGVTLPIRSDAVRVGILPGSRSDAPQNARMAMRRLRRVVELLTARRKSVQAFVSVAPGACIDEITQAIGAEGFALTLTGSNYAVVAEGQTPGLDIIVVKGCFGDVLRASDIVLGQAGTGNEQAAGLGRPVVAALEPDERPGQMRWYRMRQQRLLGEALLVLPSQDEEFARGVVELLDNPVRRMSMARIGRLKVGSSGAAAAIAEAALDVGARSF